MNCYVSGLFGLAMLGATFSTMSVSKDQYNQLTSLLSPKLAEKYHNIVNERRNHYVQGVVFGLLITYFILKNYQLSNEFHKMAFSVGITGMISVLYYFLMPKTDYMLRHLKSPEEIKAWLKIYKTMKTRYFLGFLFGLLSAIPIANSLC